MLWKGLKTETVQHGNGQKNGNLPKTYFLREFPLYSIGFFSFRSNSGFYGSNIFEGFLKIFDQFPHIFGSFPVSGKVKNFQFDDRFPVFFICFRKFLVCFRFSKKVINFQFVGRFFFLFRSVSAYFYSISGFQKSY